MNEKHKQKPIIPPISQLSLWPVTRTTCQSTQYWAYSNGAVVARATCNEQQSSTSMHLLQVIFDASEHYVICLKVHTATHCVHYRVRLLKNLLLHERPVVAYNTQHLLQYTVNTRSRLHHLRKITPKKNNREIAVAHFKHGQLIFYLKLNKDGTKYCHNNWK